MGSILIVEDNRTYARITASWLVRNGLDARYVMSIDAAKAFLSENETELVLSDFRLGEDNGMELLEWMKSRGYRIPFFIMTGYAEIPGAVEAVRKGVENYLSKPIQTEKVLNIIRETLGRRKRDNNMRQAFYIGKSPLALRLQQHIRLVAPVDSLAVLIRGASGTGKEYVARQVHALSGRAEDPFIAVDCGALPKELAASELFGHVKGAFTGATENKDGMFALANYGTLFLDEVGNLNQDVQRLLLRVLQEKCYRPVGGKEEVRTNIRLVAATNEDLEKRIAEGRFREDLFYRLNEFSLQVPQLTECLEDIIPLAEFMLEVANREWGRDVKGFDQESQKKMKEYSWPGNIRELRIIVRRAVLLAKDDWIVAEDMDLPTGRQQKRYALNDEQTEREAIVRALKTAGNNRKAAARLLRISRSTLYLKLKKYQLE